ncbi:MAG: hypothetical protein FWC29_06150 [Methanomassiliicoccaceae archaeon]|nr:hypothetical protein [Methanomassiliicoccaceae archaeon]
MANYKVKLMRPDDKLGIARVMDVRLGEKRFLTPFKTLNSPSDYHLLEVYQPVDEELIRESREGRTDLDRLPGKCKSNTVNLVIPEYRDVSISDRSLCDLENRIHPNSDIIIVPRWDGILKSTNETDLPTSLWSISKRYIEEVRRINGKLIMGNIPMNRTQFVIDVLVDKYFKEGITSFVLDYEACQAPGKAHIIRSLAKKLVDGGFHEESLLYQINMKKSHNYKDIKPADDLLSFVDGIDILGNFHMRGGGGKEGIAKMFSQEDWIYYDGMMGGRSREEINKDNHKKINKEADIVKKEILESGTALALAKKKRGASEYTNMSAQTTLDFGGIGWN